MSSPGEDSGGNQRKPRLGKYDQMFAFGSKRGNLTSLGLSASKAGHKVYLFLCDCGVLKWVSGSSVMSGATISCGCESARLAAARCKSRGTHNLSTSPLYGIWHGMMQRCYNPTVDHYARYGGRGIQVCDEWHSLERFHHDMLPGFLPGLTLDRQDNEKGYFPSNVKWSSQVEQQRNRRNNRLITFEGVTQCASAWAESIGISSNLFRQKIDRDGKNLDQLLAPVGAA